MNLNKKSTIDVTSSDVKMGLDDTQTHQIHSHSPVVKDCINSSLICGPISKRNRTNSVALF